MIEQVRQKCHMCVGQGVVAYIGDKYYVHDDLHVKRAQWNNDPLFFVRCPVCQGRAISRNVLVPEIYQTCTFSTYVAHSESQKYVYVKLQEHFQQYQQDKQSERIRRGICLSGNTGIGKTHLLVSLLRELYKIGYSVLYTTEDDIVSRIKQHELFKTDTLSHVVEQCVNAYSVIGLSRLGSLSGSWDRHVIALFLMTLYELQRVQLLCTTQFNDEKSLEQRLENDIGDVGVYSRFRNLCPYIYQLHGIDYREKMRIH